MARRAFGHVPDAYNAEPRNEALSDRFERQVMPDAPLPSSQQQAHAPADARDPWIEQMYAASQNADDHAWDTARHAAAQDYLTSPGGMQFQQQANAMNSNWDAQLQLHQQAQAAQQSMQQVQQSAQGPGR